MQRNAQTKVIRRLEREGGEIRAENGSYRLPAVSKLFGVSSVTVQAMVNEGIIEKEGTKTSTVAYKLVGYDGSKDPQRIDLIQNPAPTRKGKVRSEFDQDKRIAAAAVMLFGDVKATNLLSWLQWVNLTKELM